MPANRCPVHGIPDCSPLLNGCNLPARLAEVESLRADLAAALARNAELERRLGAEHAQGTQDAKDYTALRAELDAEQQHHSETLDRLDSAVAELDNLRDRVTALAEATPWKTTDHLGNVTGYLINADELRAIVRGSDDE